VDCKSVGSGQKALVYLGRYLYRGTQPEKDILSDRDGPITFRIRDNRGAERIQNLPGAEFLGMLLRHVLPKRFRRARDYGLLHGNSRNPGGRRSGHPSAVRIAEERWRSSP
jgi:hypothetical protein